MKINSKAMIGILINIVFMGISIMLLRLQDRLWIEGSFFLYIITVVINIFILKKLNKSILTISVFFYLVSILFNLSQMYLGYISSTNYYCIFNLLSFSACKQAFSYAYICIHVMIMSYYLFYLKFESGYKLRIEMTSSKDVALINKLFYFFWTIKLVIRIYQFIFAIKYGYLKALSLIQDSILGMFTMTADILSIVFLLHCEEKKQKRFLIILIGLEVIFMLTGSRIYGVTYIILLLVSVVNKRNIKSSKIFGLVLVGIVGFVFLEMIVNGRLEGHGYSLSYLKKEGLISKICQEFGLTMLDTTVAMEHQNEISYLHGLSYYGGALPIVPNFEGMYTSVLQKMQFMNQLNNFFRWNYGGSNVAESFFNFGYYGVFVFVPVGIILRFIETKMYNYRQVSIGKQIAIIAFTYQFIIWNRNCFYNCTRLPIWLGIIWFVLKNIVITRKRS